VIGTLQSIGQETVALLGTGPVVFHLKTSTESEVRQTWNVIAETDSGDANRVVVVGAHLDSVLPGPGINDNGSGSATILEIAETFAAQGREARNKLRFMWYGAEEFNLLGSTFYVNSLTQAEKDQIMAMVNFDMVGSPNYVRFVYDGDNSAGGGAVGPPGSAFIESLFIDYFNSQSLASDPTPFNGRSDYGPFIANGIPAGGLFTGAEGIKTAAQRAIYGGTAGIAYDPCYHQACDTYANNSDNGLDQMSDAAAHVVLTLSRTKVDVSQADALTALRTSGSVVADAPGPDEPIDR
jgi:Zn-dependent M28 family amino/carboxypeptidase